MPAERQLPTWVYKEKRPTSDQEYFENLTRCIFQAGLSWQLMANKWPNFQNAFDNFDIKKISSYRADDILRLSKDKSIIRNNQKIIATIQNAREFERIVKEHGGFQVWLDSYDKTNNYELVIKALKSRFKRVGLSTAHIFLWSVGEKIEHDPSVHTRRPTKIV